MLVIIFSDVYFILTSQDFLYYHFYTCQTLICYHEAKAKNVSSFASIKMFGTLYDIFCKITNIFGIIVFSLYINIIYFYNKALHFLIEIDVIYYISKCQELKLFSVQVYGSLEIFGKKSTNIFGIISKPRFKLLHD